MINKEKYRPLPPHVTIKPSKIDGLGLFATRDIDAELELGMTHYQEDKFQDGFLRTPLGGFINHSDTPNCWVREHLGNYHLVTLTDIEEGEELTLCYNLYDPTK